MDIRLQEEVWLVGKGPSLDNFKWTGSGPRIAINEAAYCVPDCTAAIAVDYHVLDKFEGRDGAEQLPNRVAIMLKKTHLNKYSFCNPLWIWDSQHVADMHSTAPIVIQLLATIGVKIIHFVGFDAIDSIAGYAKKIENIEGQGTNMDDYRIISTHVLNAINAMNITPVWEHRCV